MPIYEYRCEACGHELDALQKISEARLRDCPECAEPALKKLVSAPSFRLKGSGWYETDFKKDKRRNLADGSDGAKDGSKETKSDGKADAKSGDGKSGETKTASPAKTDAKSGSKSSDGKAASA